MLQEQSRLFQRLLFIGDMLLVISCWVAAYFIRFEILTPPEWLPLERYLGFLPWVVILSAIVFWTSGLYSPDRAQRLPLLVFTVAKAVGLGLLVVMASLSLYRALYFSRLHMLLFGLITPLGMILLRMVLYYFIRRARQQGRYLKRVLIVGAGKAGQKLASAFRQYPWMGFDVVGFVDDNPGPEPVLGTVEDTPVILDRFEAEQQPIDYVYIALPLSATPCIEALMNELSTRLSHVCLVPDLLQYDILNSRITDVDGLPVIHVMDEGPIEVRRFAKRAFDVAFSLCVLIFTLPLLLLLALGVKLSSPGPVFYKQRRMSLNGQTFDMLKFRSMPVDAEQKTGAVWATPGEKRATPFGAFLRRTSLDELPQFINVIRGDMSVVGPRPERPVFIEQFRSSVPRYMLRHKVKAGITGWAQVNGWRGDTSLEKRIECDLYYIQNWSLRLDVKIMWLTLWRGFTHEHAY
jgi:putative colanic acid biosysnthesis UDP-glucose lipid carrier transferase